jgi:hypothetical protein
MFMQRLVFQAKYGKAGEVVEALKAYDPIAKHYGLSGGRVYTDLAGKFDTVVWETEFDDLKKLEEVRQLGFKDPEFGQWFKRLQPLIKGGSRELYRLEHSL